MSNRETRKRMLEYIVQKLTDNGLKAEPVQKKLVTDFKSSYVKVEPKGIVLLCDREYTKDPFVKLVKSAKKQYENVAVVFLKDGESYFRAGMPKISAKADGKSLKNYDSVTVNKMIQLRPEELYALSRSQERNLQYYQPESERLNEGIVEYKFQSVLFEYSHVDKDRFQPPNRCSVRIYQWTDKKEHFGPLALDKRKLIFIPEKKNLHACFDCRDEKYRDEEI